MLSDTMFQFFFLENFTHWLAGAHEASPPEEQKIAAIRGNQSANSNF
jgi:hypothetical protein